MIDQWTLFEVFETITGKTHIVPEGNNKTLCGRQVRAPGQVWMHPSDGMPEYASCRSCQKSYLKLIGRDS